MAPRRTREGYLRVDITGKSPALWRQHRERLVTALQEVVNDVSQCQPRNAAREDLMSFTSALAEYAKHQLQSPNLEHARILEDIRTTFVLREKVFAEVEKIYAEAEALRFKTAVHKLRLHLQLTKAMLVGETGKEAIVFGQEVDAFLEALRKLDTAG